MELVLVHLFPDLLNLYGDRGNLIALRERARRRGIRVTVRQVRLEEPLPRDGDLFLVGGGEDRQQTLVAQALRGSTGQLRSAAQSGAVVFAVCGGYQLLGHAYRTAEGQELSGVGLLDVVTEHPGHNTRRLVGDVVATCTVPGVGELVGFENHGGRTRLGPGARPLATVRVGFGNNGEDGTEGAWCGTVFGTYLHGPVLPKNPRFADYLLRLALRRRYGDVHLQSLDDRAEEAAHAAAAARARVPR
ncbi:MAG: glutamine amidotransferase [Armatimonadota bacterium]|nr:glutamine amidotransferase [Armatimonadota bacterium]MDW8154996.1 glutamine amidotransferase [Armatimonadota bacterium]